MFGKAAALSRRKALLLSSTAQQGPPGTCCRPTGGVHGKLSCSRAAAAAAAAPRPPALTRPARARVGETAAAAATATTAVLVVVVVVGTLCAVAAGLAPLITALCCAGLDCPTSCCRTWPLAPTTRSFPHPCGKQCPAGTAPRIPSSAPSRPSVSSNNKRHQPFSQLRRTAPPVRPCGASSSNNSNNGGPRLVCSSKCTRCA